MPKAKVICTNLPDPTKRTMTIAIQQFQYQDAQICIWTYFVALTWYKTLQAKRKGGKSLNFFNGVTD